MLKTILAISVFCYTAVLSGQAQTSDSVAQVVYLLGNTATAPLPEAHWQAFQQQLQSEQSPYTIVHLGDIVANTGWEKQPTAAATAKLNQLLSLADKGTKGKLYLIPGDKDWDNSGPGGLAKVRNLEKYIADHQTNAQVLVPGNGCPGPQIIDIGKSLRLIAINTPWWMHPYQKPVEPETDCNIISAQEFVETMQEAIDGAEGRQILMVGHHPVLSNGTYGGHMPLKKHLFPLSDIKVNNRVPLPGLGSIYAAYRQNVGTPRDMANPRYQQFKSDMERLLKLNNQLIYAAAHDYSLQLNRVADNYHLVSGSFTQKDFVAKNLESIFNRATTGYTKLTFYSDGKVTTTFYEFTSTGLPATSRFILFQSACAPEPLKNIPVNQQVGPCIETNIPAPIEIEEVTEIGNRAKAVAGSKYQVSGLKKKFFGSLYRQSWTQPVQVPLLHLSRTKNRLRPLQVEGGGQTATLRLRAADGHQFMFRSIDKDPVGAIPPELRTTVVTDVLRQITPTQQPYGALVVSSLLDSTDILHAQPRLFVLADDPALGPFRENYKGFFGMLEERPLSPTRTRSGFDGASDVRNTFDLFRQLYQDHNYRIDAQAYGKARAFDMLIGDWGRQADNWRWAGFKVGSQIVYRPIPHDRDHAFSRWNGVVPWLADREWAIPNIQDFDEDLDGIRSLTWAARHLDRYLLTSLTRQDWLNFAQYLQTQLTDPVIDKAIATLPKEVAAGQGQEIGRVLKIRRDRLPAVLEEYYEMMARYVDVVGTNKNEYFKVERLPDTNVRVQVFKRADTTNIPLSTPFYDRTFLESETKEIRLYGLNGQDVFDITGNAEKSIRVRVIGGLSMDSIRDASTVNSARKTTLVYDNLDTRLELGPESRNLTSDDLDINYFSPTSFAYNSKNPNGSLIFNKNDGVGISFGINYKRQRFRKQEFGSLYSFNIRATQFGNLQLTSNLLWRNTIGKWDLGTYLDLGYYFQSYFFFGLGNNTQKDEKLYDDDFYRARYGGVMSAVFVQRRFLHKSIFRIGPLFETLTTDFKSNSFLGQAEENPTQSVNTTNQHLVGGNVELVLDLRDKLVFTQRGLRFLVRHKSYKQINGSQDFFGLTEGFVDYYGTGRIFLPLTLAVRVGGAKNYGDNLPYYKYTTLGLRPNLRGYVINRFAGDASLYLNSELRLHLGEVESAFLPFRYGLIGFFDRGRVWYNGNSSGGWHDGYGGGFYVAPVAERFAFSVLLQHSREENILFSFGIGFRFDQ